MTKDTRPPFERVRDVTRIQESMVQAVQEALVRHKRAGKPVAVWRNGRVEWIQPEDIPESPGEE
jgi:hypothetical protein